MAIEDVGIFSLLLEKLCKPTKTALLDFKNLNEVARLYELLRLPRTTGMLKASQALGDMQLARAQSNWMSTKIKEFGIWLNVKRYGTLPIMFNGAGYRYRDEVMKMLDPKARL